MDIISSYADDLDVVKPMLLELGRFRISWKIRNFGSQRSHLSLWATCCRYAV